MPNQVRLLVSEPAKSQTQPDAATRLLAPWHWSN